MYANNIKYYRLINIKGREHRKVNITQFVQTIICRKRHKTEYQKSLISICDVKNNKKQRYIWVSHRKRGSKN